MHTKTATFLHTGSLQCVKQLYACILFFFNLCWWKQWVHSSSFWVAWAVLFHNTASHLQVVDESEWFLQKNKQKNEHVLQGPFRMQWQASSAESVYLVSQLLCFHIYRQRCFLPVHWFHRRWGGKFKLTRGRIWSQWKGECQPWSSLIEAPARRCRKRSNRRSRGGGPARTVSPLRRSAAPAACASCWPDSTSPWWEPLPSPRSCLLPIPRSSWVPSSCWWPFPFSEPAACAAACPLPTARTGQRWDGRAGDWWDVAGWPAGLRLK